MPTPFLSAGSAPKVRKTVGIDLGTTNSVIALLDAADSALLTGADEQGRKTFPSVLGWHAEQGRLVAGRPARDLAPGPARRPSRCRCRRSNVSWAWKKSGRSALRP